MNIIKNLKAYSADLGLWKKGIVVNFQAENDEHAIKMAFDHFNSSVIAGTLTDSDMVVKVQEDRRIFYDFVNGHMKG